jgi:hypothetical protein
MLHDVARELSASPAHKLGFILAGAGGRDLYGLGAYADLAGRAATPATDGARQDAEEVVEQRPTSSTRWG